MVEPGVDDEDRPGTVTRRTVLLAAAAGTVGVSGVATARYWPDVWRRLHRDDASPSVPVPRERTPILVAPFASAARGRTVDLRVAVPRELRSGDPVTVVVWLHGRGNTPRTVMDTLKLPNFLAAAIAAGVNPFVVAAVDGADHSYWHRRVDGDDPEAMIVDELPAQLAAQGITVARWGIAGYSMGGYGALLLAERHTRFRAVAASSPAVWFHAGDTRPGAFDSPSDFATHDVLAHLDRLPPAVRIDCGSDDPFASSAAALLRRVPTAQGRIAPGAHTMRFWRSALPAQLTFLGAALTTT